MTNEQKQNLLQFLGLYTGAIDGIWGPKSQEAMEKVRAKYEGSEDDEALLTAVGEWEDDATDNDDGHKTGTFWDEIVYFDRDEFMCTCGKRGCNIVLCGQGVGTGYIHFSAAGCQYLAQVRSLCFQMYGKSDFLSCKRFGSGKFFFQGAKQITISLDPLNFLLAGFGKVNISDFAVHVSSPFLLSLPRFWAHP